jgi:hypothetical protein
MTKFFLATLTAALIAPLARADATDQAIVAAMKIVDAPNYAWACYVPSAGRALLVREGKTEKNGFSLVTFIDPQSPMLRQISRLNDGAVVAVFHGPDNFVFQTSDGWKTGPELPPLGPRRRGSASGSDYWIAVQMPHEELEIIVGSYTELHAVKGGVAGTMSEAGARQLLGSTKAPAATASGTFVLGVANGVLSSYALDLTGTVLVGPPGEEKESPPQHRLLITEFKDVGHAVPDVPDEAKLKLAP